jgi:5-methylcytosine-specific restriction endonuclease McrA
MTFRCQACRRYIRGAPYRRIGLGAVCSETCATLLATRPRHARPTEAIDRPRSRTPAIHHAPGIPPATRRCVAERDKRCRYCGKRADLHLHHIVYRSSGGSHDETNLIVLCGDHHAFVHQNKRVWQPILQKYIRMFYDEHRQLFLLDIKRNEDSTEKWGR